MNREQEEKSRSLLGEETVEMLLQVHQDALWILENLGEGCKQPVNQGASSTKTTFQGRKA